MCFFLVGLLENQRAIPGLDGWFMHHLPGKPSTFPKGGSEFFLFYRPVRFVAWGGFGGDGHGARFRWLNSRGLSVPYSLAESSRWIGRGGGGFAGIFFFGGGRISAGREGEEGRSQFAPITTGSALAASRDNLKIVRCLGGVLGYHSLTQGPSFFGQ